MDDDVDMLIPRAEVVDSVKEFKESEQDMSRTFLKIGITQLVFGMVTLIGGIIVTALSYEGVDVAGGGIWCGVIVLVCGSLAITSRYHLLYGVVIASLVVNIFASVLLLAGIVLSIISAVSNIVCPYCYGSTASYVGLAALNCGLIVCIVLCVYMAIVYGKILNEKNNFKLDCCLTTASQNPGDYSMAYVSPGIQQRASSQEVGAYLAAPLMGATQIHQS